MPSEPLLQVKSLSKSFLPANRPAIRDIDLTLERGTTLGIVGPSGSGKSTLARCLALFEQPDAGIIRFEGKSLAHLDRSERAQLRPQIQLVLQQPAAALNPGFTAAEIIAEPLVIQKRATPREARRRAAEVMESIGLPGAAAGRPALSFSGGERQRLALARALLLEPKLLILDESLAGLDLSVRAQISRLLVEAQQQLGTAYIVIAHDVRLVASLTGELVVMEAGAIVERGATAEVMAHPRHPRTAQMLDAAAKLSLHTAKDGDA
ncbi:MAG TPA: ATP-binding cassette domain-containing protein [Bryobacteraceae bacterium]|nr:ATP-binding cassette domain-containing protein [Bryobacteraceae bacterium]